MTAACKCCDGPTRLFGTVDAARSCADGEGPAFPPSGRQVSYWECCACGFVFTSDFDAMSDADIGATIYDADYARADPDFTGARPHYFADLLARLLAPAGARLRILDYGGGAGALTELLRARGMACDNYDPYFAGQPLGDSAYDLVTAFEVAEHSRDPLGTFRAALARLRPDGALLFSTQLRPPGAGIDWWYVAPRNGHFSLHAQGSLQASASRLGMLFVALNDGLHMFYRDRKGQVPRLLLQAFGGSALYRASLLGPATFWSVAARVVGAGNLRAVLNPRHAARSMLVMAGHRRRAA